MVLSKKVEDLSLNPDFPADAKGIPKFWLHVLKNGNEEALMGLVEEHDEAVLENLTNITVALDSDNAGFTLCFHFQENAFFTNQVSSVPICPNQCEHSENQFQEKKLFQIEISLFCRRQEGLKSQT